MTTDFRDQLSVLMEDPTGFRMFKAVSFGKFSLSIQASYGHYCSPRRTLPNVADYSTFECMLMENGEDINPTTDSRFAGIVDAWSDIGAHVPVAQVQALFERCRTLFVTETPFTE